MELRFLPFLFFSFFFLFFCFNDRTQSFRFFFFTLLFIFYRSLQLFIVLKLRMEIYVVYSHARVRGKKEDRLVRKDPIMESKKTWKASGSWETRAVAETVDHRENRLAYTLSMRQTLQRIFHLRCLFHNNVTHTFKHYG